MQLMSGRSKPSVRHHAVGDDLSLAGGEAAKDRCSFVDCCRAVEVFSAHASLNELVTDVDAVADAARERDGLAALAVFVPVGDDVADELIVVHALGELGLDVVALLGAHAAQIGIDRRVDARPDEVALLDQIRHLRTLNHTPEDAAETATVTTTWRCGQSEDDGVGIRLDDLLVGHGTGVVGLVDDQEIGQRHQHAGGPDRACVQRLDARDLHRCRRPQLLLVAGLDDAVRHAASGQLVRSLVHDLSAVGDDQHAAGAAGDDSGGDDGLAGAGRRDQ
jgi:hypothetical protein